MAGSGKPRANARSAALSELELCCMTVRQASLPELIGLAAANGFTSTTTTTRLYERAGVTDAELRTRLDDAGVRIGYIDGLSSPLPGTPDGASEQTCFDMADALGTSAVNVVHFRGPPVPFAEMADAVGPLAERAADRGIRLLLEFLPGTGIPDFPTACALARSAGPDRVGVMLDTWHLARSGGGPELLTADAAALVGGLQISDRRRSQDAEPELTMGGRYLPGQGELPLVEIVGPVLAAHPALPIGIEVINDELRAMSPLAAASVAGDAAGRLLQQLGV
jgi:sugar phosphate isomerase/epimerase